MSASKPTIADGHDGTDEADPDPVPIAITTDERLVADEAIGKLAAERNLFQRGNRLVRIFTDASSPKVLLRAPDSPRIAPIPLPTLRELISRHADFTLHDKPVHPPEWCVKAIHARDSWAGIPRLRAVVDAPMLRADGSIITARGYDEATELFVWPTTPFPTMPDEPTKADAERARDELLEVFCDFPFEKDTHRAACIAAVLTVFARFAFEGTVPLVAIDKNVRGAGGTLLADAIGVIASGRPMPRTVAAKNAEEERKRITSIALSGDPIVLIDNVAGTLGTDALDAALTATDWNDRKLGTNDMTGRLPLHVTWFATGNNLSFGADTLRRVMHLRLSSPHERPEERTGFRHPDLLGWVRAERPRLVIAALTMLRAYCIAGRPDAKLVPWGSFEKWSELVRGAVVWAGLPDPGRTREELTSSADTEHMALVDFVAGWRDMFGDAGGTVAQALEKLERKPDFVDEYVRLRSALAEFCPTTKPGTLPTARALGAAMKRARGRVVAGQAIEVKGAKGASGVRWVVRRVSDSSDTGDSVSPYLREKSSKEEGSRESLASLESLSQAPRRRKRSELRRASA